MAFYSGNRCVLSAVSVISDICDKHLSPDARSSVEYQLLSIEEEVIQLRTFINDNHPENDLPTKLRR